MKSFQPPNFGCGVRAPHALCPDQGQTEANMRSMRDAWESIEQNSRCEKRKKRIYSTSYASQAQRMEAVEDPDFCFC